MKIISVRFANLNSLPGPFLIRFDATPLADTGLFAITGPTGAGKSTLLDAIAVGLYGRVPRHGRQVGEMVSRHAPEAFSEVEFEVHETDPDTGTVDRVRYRSRWEVKRKKRGENKGEVGQDAMSLVLSPSGEAVISGKEAVPARVSELSGLDFGQFEQSVLLSQGKFARFLHAPENERSALLEKMTNVGIYSRLSVAAYEKAKAEQQQTRELQIRLDAAKLLTEQERTHLETRLDQLSDKAEQHHEEERELAICLTWRTILDQLDQQLTTTTAEAVRLERAEADLQPEFARLAGHARAAAADKPLDLAEAAGREVRRDEQQLLDLAAARPDLARAVATAEAAHATATAAHAAAAAEEDRMRPILSEAQRQDAALAAAARELALKEAAHAQRQREHDEAVASHEAEQQAIAKLQAQDETLRSWLVEHSAEVELKNQLLTLNREIIDLQGAQKELATRATRRDELHKQQQTLADDLRQLRQQEAAALANQEAIRQEGQPCRTERDALLAGTTPAALAQRADDLSAHRQALAALLPKAEAAEPQQRRATHLALAIEEHTGPLAAAEAAVQHLAGRRADGQKLLDSYRRELRTQQALADLNAHRQHLRPGEACPLCGALEHAFDADFTAGADEQEQRVTEQQQTLHRLDEEWRAATAGHSSQQAAQQQRLAQRAEAEAAAQTLAQEAAGLAATLAPPLAAPTDPAAVREQLAAAAAAQEAAAAARRRLTELDEKLTALRDKYVEATTQVTDTQRDIPRLLDREQALRQEQAALADEVPHWEEQAAIFQSAIRDFLRPHGLALPARPPYDGLLATLRERADHHEAQVHRLNELSRQLLEKTSQHRTHAEALSRQADQLREAAAALAADQQALAGQRAARQAHYAGPDPAAAAEALRQTTQRLSLAAQHTQSRLTQQQQQLAISANAQTALQAQLATHRAALVEREAELAAALAAAGLPDASAARALLLPPTEAERLQQRRQAHLTAREATAQRLATLSQELQHHAAAALTPHSTAELTAQLRALSAADDTLQQQLGAVSNQLAQDDAARAQQAAGLLELASRQREEQRWLDLSEQIGSARGDKFSQFAQGLTLSHLARLANYRLRQLTGRYTILKTPNRNLELQIIDHDQADTVRPMASLSGGESFLVSLALALGLSELAGHKARIESLFIDEGFGTLDPDALNTALDALERLQHTGKMIGIISHVTDLKDRIGTQIRVRPGAGGNSSVHVVDVRGDETSCATD